MAFVLRPQAGPQEAFLASPADITIYGGAAGGGKTYALLLETLRHVDNPGFGAVIFRRQSTQIMAEGGLFDTAVEIYSQLGADIKLTPSPSATFPSGAKISFRHLGNDKEVSAWQGSQICLICYKTGKSPVFTGVYMPRDSLYPHLYPHYMNLLFFAAIPSGFFIAHVAHTTPTMRRRGKVRSEREGRP